MSNVLKNGGGKLFSDKKYKNISTEVIDFQKDNFGRDLEEIIKKIHIKLLELNKIDTISRNRSNISIKPEIDILTKLIFSRLGIKVTFIVNSEPAAVLTVFINDNHIFLDEMYRNGELSLNYNYKEAIKKIKNSSSNKGYVNLKEAKIGGFFSQLNNKLFINFEFLLLVIKLSYQETVAVILHELGHIFYSYEYSNRLEENNQVLANSLEKLLNNKNKKDLVYIYKEIKNINNDITESDIDSIINGEGLIPNSKLIKVISGTVSSQLSNKKYNETSFEQLADNFCNRFGYGRAFISSSEKIEIRDKNFIYYSLFMSTIYYTLLPILLILSILSPTIILLKIFNVFIYSTITYYSYYFLGENNKDYTYDNLKIRYNRIKNDMVEILKNKDISKEESLKTIKEIEEIESVIKTIYVPETINKKLIDYFISSNRNTKSSINEQQLMEDLVSNDLFIKSEKLKTI